MTKRKQIKEIMEILNRHPEAIHAVYTLLKENLPDPEAKQGTFEASD